MEKKVLTEEEIKELTSYRDNNINYIYLLGQLEYQKILMDQENEKLIKQVIEAEKQKEILGQKITEKYGSNAEINLEEGTITV